MIVGVGGQGTLLASRIIGNVAIKAGFDVKLSEVHGMSQRGGSVVTYVKYDKKVYSPLIFEGEADYLLAFEELEAYRWLSYLKPSGHLIVNTQQMDPMPVITGTMNYPDNIISKIKSKLDNVTAVNALKCAVDAGTVKAVNIVLIGCFAKRTDVDKSIWIDVIKETVPPKFLEINLKAFELGYNS